MSVDPKAYRRTLGHFATGVTVVTIRTPEGYHGMTANAVSSVSLDPPLVLVCVDHRTQLHAHFQKGVARGFAVNVLSKDQQDLSNHFAKIATLSEDPFRTRRVRLGGTGAPILEDSLAWIDCSLHSQFIAGDHTIYVGQVLDLGYREDALAPLIFFRGAYGTFQ